jgi:hypothetical protein
MNGSATNLNYDVSATVMPGTCTFNAMYVNAVITTSAANNNNTLTYTLYKNNAVTSLSTSVTVSTPSSAVTNSNTSNTVTVTPGDTLAIGLTQTNGAPVVRSNVTVRCQ